jgi:hypothetical protein
MQTITEWFSQLSPVWQALIATVFTWGVTALGAALVFFFREVNQKVRGDDGGQLLVVAGAGHRDER